MDTNNWRPAQGGGEPTIDTYDWRTQLQPDSRQSIVNMIMYTLKIHLPFFGQAGLQELKKIAVRFEEKIYTAATSQYDYLSKICLQLLAIENKSQNSIAKALPSNSASNSKNPPDAGVSNVSQSMVNSLQLSSNIDSGQGNALSSLQQIAVGSLQQNPVSAPHQMLQTQQLKQQYQQRQVQQQLMHKQQILQQQRQQQQQPLHQQTKMQQNAQLQAHQMPQLHQMNDVNELKMRMGVKSGVFKQHHSVGQRSAYHHQQLKSGPPFPISSPQLLSVSPQMPQHPSPQINQQNLITSLTKTGTPLQSANSPFIVPSPSTPLAPSPIPGESVKVNSNVSALSNTGNIGHQHSAGVVTPAQSLAIGTHGISASPLLAELTTPDGNHGNASTGVSCKSSVTEQPFERLIKVVKSMSPKALSASVSDIGSVVSMIDRIAGSAPGNGSRAAVGEDLVAMTKCCLQSRNFVTRDGNTKARKMRRYTNAMPLNVVSSAGSINDSLKHLTGSEASDLESTVTSTIKRPRIEI